MNQNFNALKFAHWLTKIHEDNHSFFDFMKDYNEEDIKGWSNWKSGYVEGHILAALEARMELVEFNKSGLATKYYRAFLDNEEFKTKAMELIQRQGKRILFELNSESE